MTHFDWQDIVITIIRPRAIIHLSPRLPPQSEFRVLMNVEFRTSFNSLSAKRLSDQLSHYGLPCQATLIDFYIKALFKLLFGLIDGANRFPYLQLVTTRDREKKKDTIMTSPLNQAFWFTIASASR